MSKPRTHLVVGTPCYGGQVTSLYTLSLMRLQAACAQRGDIDLLVNLLWGDALITRCRQNLVTQFLENSLATHLMFIDADISFDPTQVFRLLDLGVDIAAGVYPVKRVDWAKVKALAKEGIENLESAALSYVLEFENPQKIENRNGFAKVRYAGTGFMLIRREVFLKMIERYPELSYSKEHQSEDPWRGSKWRSALFNCILDQATGVYLSEDFSFCKRWTDMGGEIWVDLASKLAHTGTQTFYGNVTTQFAAPAEQKNP